MSDGLLVTLNDEEFAAEASEVHIIDHIGSLSCYLIDGLTINDTDNHNMLLQQLTPDKYILYVSQIIRQDVFSSVELTKMTSWCFLES